MIEYSVVTLVLSIGGLGLMAVPMPGVNSPLFKIFWDGLNGFYESVFYVMQSSVP